MSAIILVLPLAIKYIDVGKRRVSDTDKSLAAIRRWWRYIDYLKLMRRLNWLLVFVNGHFSEDVGCQQIAWIGLNSV